MTSTTFRTGVEAVVTGASGFIGQAVCRELGRRGIKVYGVSRKADLALPGVEWVAAGDYTALRVPHDAACIHLAGTANVQAVQANPVGETDEALRIAQALLRHGFSRILFASSGVVYGDHISTPRREDEPVAPLTPYGQMKYAVEQLLLAHGQVVARLGNVYGRGMPSNSIIPEIVAQIPGSGDIVVRDSAPVRDYVYIDDAVRGIVDLALSSVSGIYNLGTGRGTSVGQLAQLILQRCGQPDRPIVSLQGETERHPTSIIILNPGKIKTQLGWSTQVFLEDGIKNIV